MAIVGPSTPPSGDYQPPKERSGIFKRMSAFVSKIFGRQGPYDVSPPQPPTPLSDEAKAIIEKLRQRGIAVTKNDEEDINIFCKTLIEQRDKEAPAGEVGGYTTTIGRSFSTFNEKGQLIPVKERKPIRVTITPNPNGRDIDVTLAGDELSKGSFGSVNAVTNLYGKEPLVAKEARRDLPPQDRQEATDSLIAEQVVFAKIYKDRTLQVTGLPPPSALADTRFAHQDTPTTVIKSDDQGNLYVEQAQQTENPTEKIAHISNEELPGQRSTLLLAKRYDSDLFDFDSKKHTPKELRSIFAQVAQGLAFLHSKNIAHKDLKPENILVRGSGDDIEAVITDFGGAVLADPKEMRKSDWSYGGVHTPSYTVLNEETESLRLACKIMNVKRKKTIAQDEEAADKVRENDPIRVQLEVNLAAKKAELSHDIDAFQSLNKQQDVFSFCLMIIAKADLMKYIVISEDEEDEAGYIQSISCTNNKLEKALRDDLGLSPTAASVIVKGLTMKREERPSAEKIAAALSPYLGSPPPTI